MSEEVVKSKYLTEYEHLVATNLSYELREFILHIDSTNATEKSYRLRYDNFQKVLAMYRAEHAEWVKTNICPELELLANLFWIVTKRTKVGAAAQRKGKLIPYWGLDLFNYCFILGHAKDPEVSNISWRLTDEFDVPITTVCEVFRIVKEVSRVRKDLSQKSIYEEVITLLKKFDDTGKAGLNRVWSAEIQAKIKAHFFAGHTVPEKKAPRPGNPKIASSPPPPMNTAPEPPPAAAQPVREVRTPVLEEKALQEAMSRLLETRFATTDPGWRTAISENAMAMLDDTIQYVRYSCYRHASQQREQENMLAATVALQERTEYVLACEFYGLSPPLGGIIDEAAVKKLYRQMSKDSHPDRNVNDPGAASRFDRIQQSYATIRNYNHKYREKEQNDTSVVQQGQLARSRSPSFSDEEGGEQGPEGEGGTSREARKAAGS